MSRSLTRPTVIDLFCGAGGMSLGFRAAGCHIFAGADIDEAAAETYRTNFARLQPGGEPRLIFGDEGNLEELNLGRLAESNPPDILIGGPPCQGFSRIGRAKLDSLSEEGFAGDPRNDLYHRFLEAVDFWRPSAVVMENVPGMLSVKERNVADEAAADLAGYGYRVGYAVLNAVWYGVPQFRERLFFVGIREDLQRDPVLPEPTHFAELPSGYMRPESANLPLPFLRHFELSVNPGRATLPATTVVDALDDLPRLTYHLEMIGDKSGRPPEKPLKYRDSVSSSFAQLMRHWPGLRGLLNVCNHVIRRTPRDYESFRRMKPGDRYPEAIAIAKERLQERLTELAAVRKRPEPGTPEYRELERSIVPPYTVDSFIDKWRKLISDQPSWTVPAHLSKDAYSHIHYDSDQARAISIREAARLQSFPDAFRFRGNMGDCYRQIGNAVPPLLAWAIASTLMPMLGFRARSIPWPGYADG